MSADALSLSSAVSLLYDYPFLDATLWVPHCVIMCGALRQYLGGDGEWRRFSRRHPLPCLMLAVIYVFPGAIVGSLLLAEPPLAFLVNANVVLPAVVAWYLTFYAPFDFFYKIIDGLYLWAPFGAMQDFLRVQLVQNGVDTIHALHPSGAAGFLYPCVFAACKSSGFLFIKYAEQLMLHRTPRVPPFSIPNVSTKTCVACAVAMAANAAGLIAVDRAQLFAAFGAAIVLLRFFNAASGLDPFSLFEHLFCGVTFGRHDVDGDVSGDDGGKKEKLGKDAQNVKDQKKKQ